MVRRPKSTARLFTTRGPASSGVVSSLRELVLSFLADTSSGMGSRVELPKPTLPVLHIRSELIDGDTSIVHVMRVCPRYNDGLFGLCIFGSPLLDTYLNISVATSHRSLFFVVVVGCEVKIVAGVNRAHYLYFFQHVTSLVD